MSLSAPQCSVGRRLHSCYVLSDDVHCVAMSSQRPTVAVTVRFTPAQIALIDSWAGYLTKKRTTITNRSDVLRVALAKMPAPQDGDGIQAALRDVEAEL